ncbi:MAG: hypothetical protein E7011_01625 [Alphaproteobacteria bacterium]|nr:hypothetical protein [Alphaproteobacteria bacterium]
MDQFCTLKNDDYRRCSCNDRVFKLTEVRKVLQDAGEQLTVFTENLDTVGMTAAQAAAMRQETEGEKAFTDDNSASKALLNAIMNSIRGQDSSVGGKYADLNSINIAFDTVNAFGMTDVGQAIAAYNGNALYNAVYPQCRQAVRADCNDASLQRAITAYLMAIEQDCNTVQTAIENTQKQLKSAIREGGAMLDLARIENRQKHNTSDIPTCINEVEAAITSEEVCGANYHKCLDNGEFIDISTGAPITGVENFYQLEEMLTFSDGIEAVDQKLSKNPSNRTFVFNFEKRVKKFAEPALDKCVENADLVWSEYLDKAMLSIFYAQKDKVAQIKQGCFDYISACYINSDTAITAAMAGLSSETAVVLQPDKIKLNAKMCQEYVNSCDNMFAGNIIADYINNQTQTDTLTACRAAVKQCFDKYGGTNYENFYYPYSGLFEPGYAPDWFTLYDTTENKERLKNGTTYVSRCAEQLTKIPACNNTQMIESAFGGMDYYATNTYGISGKGARNTRATGVATEIYNQVLSQLATQCMNLQGRFVEYQHIQTSKYDPTDFCKSTFDKSFEYNPPGTPDSIYNLYSIGAGEDMCPRDYRLQVDTQSWGACLCWENGARRSKWGQSAKCVTGLPVMKNPLHIQMKNDKNEDICTNTKGEQGVCGTVNAANEKYETPVLILQFADDTECNSANMDVAQHEDNTETTDINEAVGPNYNIRAWCTQTWVTKQNQVCPLGTTSITDPKNSKVYCMKGEVQVKHIPGI